MSSMMSSARRYSRAIRVVSAWVSDPRFQTPDGQPAVLPLRDLPRASSQLVKEFSGDIPAAAMLSVLEIGGTVAQGENGISRLSEPIFRRLPAGKDRHTRHRWAELIATIGHNSAPVPRIVISSAKCPMCWFIPTACPPSGNCPIRCPSSCLKNITAG